jgi:cytidylate kinase
MDVYPSVMYSGPTIDQQIYQAGYDTIRNLSKESCVIVGRCADYILRDCPELVSVFVHANDDFRAERVMAEYHVSDAKAREMLGKTDKKRASYYNFQSDKKWGMASSYNLCLESSSIGIDRSVDLILDYIHSRKQ